MELSIIIVNWNSIDYLQKCLSKVFSKTRDIEFEVIVIDSGSFDGSHQMVQQHFPSTKFIQSDHNLGFAKANNEAYRISRGNYILFLNPDTEIEDNAFHKLMMHLEAIPNAGAIGAKLLNTDGSIQTTCIRRFPSILEQLLDSDHLQKHFPRWGIWGMAPILDEPPEPVAVEAVSGACLMVKRLAFENAGMFSDDYFMYSEDIDLCHKLSKSGWLIYFDPTAKVIHHGGGSSSKRSVNTFSSVMMLESRYRYFKKMHSRSYAEYYKLAILLAATMRTGIILTCIFMERICGRPPSLEGSLKKWISNLRWALGLQEWVKKFTG